MHFTFPPSDENIKDPEILYMLLELRHITGKKFFILEELKEHKWVKWFKFIPIFEYKLYLYIEEKYDYKHIQGINTKEGLFGYVFGISDALENHK